MLRRSIGDLDHLAGRFGFKVLKSYTEQEDDFDEFGEKHRIFVVLLQKES